MEVLPFKRLNTAYVALHVKFTAVPKILIICLYMSLFLLYYISGKENKQHFLLNVQILSYQSLEVTQNGLNCQSTIISVSKTSQCLFIYWLQREGPRSSLFSLCHPQLSPWTRSLDGIKMAMQFQVSRAEGTNTLLFSVRFMLKKRLPADEPLISMAGGIASPPSKISRRQTGQTCAHTQAQKICSIKRET